jgi:DNA-binding MurR/RpiR family transcriptional regulator
VASVERGATPADNMRRTLEDLGQDATLALDMVLETHAEALTTLRSAAFHQQLGRALPGLHAAERIVVFGIGPLAALAQYAAMLLARTRQGWKAVQVTQSACPRSPEERTH